jgi:hypothetical protein
MNPITAIKGECMCGGLNWFDPKIVSKNVRAGYKKGQK